MSNVPEPTSPTMNTSPFRSLFNSSDLLNENYDVLSEHLIRPNPTVVLNATESVVNETFQSIESYDALYHEKQYTNLTTRTAIPVSTVTTTTETSSGILDNELRTLLQSWDLGELASHLIDEKVYVEVLKVIKRHHIERLLKHFPMGDQILFEHRLEEWRSALEIPLQHHSISRTSTPPWPLTGNVEVDSGSRSSGLSLQSQSSASHFHPYSRSPTPEPSVPTPSLATILNESSKAMILCEFYKKFGKFGDEQRSALISAIARFYEEKHTAMTLAISYRLENQILERFPTEKLEYYRTSKRGKIYSKCSNLKGSFKKSVERHVAPKLTKTKDKKGTRTVKDFVPEVDADLCIRALKFDNLSAEEFDSYWKACRQFRMQDIKKMECTADIFDKWPFYKMPSGFRLIDMDFDALHPNGDALLSRWEEKRDFLQNFLSNAENVKDKCIKSSLEYIKNHEVSENSLNATLFWALHGYLLPTSRTVCKDKTGKNSVIKYTIKDSQEAFALLRKSHQDLEDHLQYLANRKTSIQPFLLLVGDDITAIQDIYVYADGVRYSFTNLLRAVDSCFKIFYVFNLRFPEAAMTFWSFIEKCFFKINSNHCNSKIHILCNTLEEQNNH